MKRLQRQVSFTLSFTAAGLLALPTPLLGQGAAPVIPAVAKVMPMGVVKQNPLIYGRDGTYSAEIGGKSYWAFNDTSMRAYNVNGQNFISNTLSWTDSLNASNGITLNHDVLDSTGVLIEFMPFTAPEQQFNAVRDPNHCTAQPASECGEDYAIWPLQIVPIPGTTAAYQYYDKVLRGGDLADFTTIGTGIAIEIGGKVIRPAEAPGTAEPTLFWQNGETAYSRGYILENNMLYSVGCKSAYLAVDCSMARVPLLQTLYKPAYQYYAGNNTWSSDPNAAVTIFEGGAAGNSLFYDKALGKYVAVYSGFYNNNVNFRVADHPWGPWSAETLLFVGQQGESGTANYAALAHPEFEEDNVLTEYVTYVQTTGFLQQALQLVKVTFQPNQ